MIQSEQVLLIVHLILVTYALPQGQHTSARRLQQRLHHDSDSEDEAGARGKQRGGLGAASFSDNSSDEDEDTRALKSIRIHSTTPRHKTRGVARQSPSSPVPGM